MNEADPRHLEHNRIWDSKPTLKILYEDFHRRLLAAVPPGRLLDIGGGIAHLKRQRPDAVSVDILPFPGIDLVCDAHELPFRDSSFNAIVMLDVLHHLNAPTVFLKEAARVLAPGGALAMIEPGMTPASYWIYKHFHQEPANLRVDPFAPLFPDGPKDPFDSNQAIPTLLFARKDNRAELERRVPELTVEHFEWISPFAFPLSGGFKPWCLMPANLTASVVAFEDSLPHQMKAFFAFRLFTVMRRLPDPVRAPLKLHSLETAERA